MYAYLYLLTHVMYVCMNASYSCFLLHDSMMEEKNGSREPKALDQRSTRKQDFLENVKNAGTPSCTRSCTIIATTIPSTTSYSSNYTTTTNITILRLVRLLYYQ